MSQNAVSAVSFLAERYSEPPAKTSSLDIAEKRHLPKPLVAKILTILSQAGLVRGTPGPKGGYWLARAPGTITLWDVASVFERAELDIMCPFGPGWCGTGPQCPLHHPILEVQRTTEAFLKSHHFGSFQRPRPEPPAATAPPAAAQPQAKGENGRIEMRSDVVRGAKGG